MKCRQCGANLKKGILYCEHCGAPAPKRSAWKTALAAGIFILPLILAVLGVWLLLSGNGSRKYEEMISEGDKYFAAMDYSSAIISYQSAIELDPEQETGYASLANVYIVQNQYSLARDTLLQGIQYTNALDLLTLLDEVFRNMKMAETVQDLDSEKLEQLSENVLFNDEIFAVMGTYSYGDYIADYGNAEEILSDGTGVLKIRFSGFSGICDYYDLPDDSYIVDESTGMPYGNKKPNEIHFADLSELFRNFQGAVSFERIAQLLGTVPVTAYNEEEGRYELQITYRKCRIKIETDENGNITSPTAWNEIAPVGSSDGAETDEGEIGTVAGMVINAVTGNGMSAFLHVRAFSDRSGEILKTLSAASGGSYELNMPEGKYTVEVEATGFIREYFDIEVTEAQTVSNVNFTISPELKTGEVRVVLEWGATPRDLDTHAIGTSSSGVAFHISYMNRSASSGGEEIANLDVDDTDGYGPETFTLYDVGADFTYKVVDFTNSGIIGSSGATVKVYLPEQSQPTVYQVPSGNGNVWTVFSYQDGAVTLINGIE